MSAFATLKRRAAGLALFAVVRTFVFMADTCPRSWLVAMTSAMARAETRLTPRGRAAVAEAELVLGLPSREARKMAASWLPLELMSVVDARRVARRREDIQKWVVEERGGEEVHRILEDHRPLVLTIGHFAGGFGAARVIPEAMSTGALNPPEPWKLDGHVLLRRLFTLTMIDLAEVLRPGQVVIRQVGREAVFEGLVETLAAGGIAGLAIDAPWNKPGGFSRPFAGDRNRTFATGAARAARLAQAPVVLVVPEQLGARHCVLHWGPVIQPPAPDDTEADVVVMNQLLDRLETYIGRFRHLYPHPIGWERRWNRALERWEDPEAAEAAPTEAPEDAHEPALVQPLP